MRNYIDLITEDIQNQRLIENFEYAGKLISEAKLTADQINQIFTGVEKNMTAAGGNRTAIGKGVDTAKSAAGAVGTAYSGLIDKFSNTSIMKGFDAAYDKAAEQLKQATGGDQGAMQYVQKYRDFAKKHPMAQTAIYALLIAAVSIGSGGAAAPAALGLLKMGDRLVQGDKFSQALAKGATTAGAAAVGQGIKGALNTPDVPSTGAKGAASGYSKGDLDKAVKFAKMATDPDPGTSGTAKAIQAAQSSNLSKQDMMNDFAKKMGLTGDNHKAVFKGGVPVEIDGKPVPQNLYTPDQAQDVAAAKKMAAQMANPSGTSSYSKVDDTPGYSIDAKDKMSQAMGNGPAKGIQATGNNTGYELKKGPDGLEGPIVSKNGQIVPNTGASSAADAAPSNKPSVAANNTAPVRTGASSSVSDFDPEDEYDDEPPMRGGNQGYPIRSGGVGYNQGYDTRGYPIRSGGVGYNQGYDTRGYPIRSGGVGYNQDYGHNRGIGHNQPAGPKGVNPDATTNKPSANQTPGGAKVASTGYELKKGPNGLEGPIVSKDGKIVKETIETLAIQAATYNFEWIALPPSIMLERNDAWSTNRHKDDYTLTPEGVGCVFRNLERLHEHLLEAESEYGAEVKKPGIFGRLGAGIKKAAGAVAGSKFGQTVGQGVQAVKTAAGNATTTVTADKLNKAWQTAGNPMDTKALMTFLIGQGVDKGVIAATYKSLGIPLQSGGRVAGQGPSQTANAIRKRDARAAKKATAVPQTAAPAPVAKQTPAAPQATAQFGQQWTAQAKPKKAVAESRTVSMRLELP